jgi:hypothetical protein
VPGGATEARLAVLFAGGAFGVWELDSRLDLRQVRCTLAHVSSGFTAWTSCCWPIKLNGWLQQSISSDDILLSCR